MSFCKQTIKRFIVLVSDIWSGFDHLQCYCLSHEGQCKKEGKPYGLVFAAMSAGETNTSAVGIQVLRARPTLVKKVYVKDGREELVRGVELIGTPLNMLENIVAAGDDPAVFNGVCGAESGWVAVSSISPSILISEVEVQKSDKNMRKGQILPPPIFDH